MPHGSNYGGTVNGQRDEIVGALDYVRAWGGSVVVPIPKIEILG